MESGLSQKTIRKHLNNVNFYINVYLLRVEPLEMETGCSDKIDKYKYFCDIIKKHGNWQADCEAFNSINEGNYNR